VPAISMPLVGGRIQIDFPRLITAFDSSGRYTVTDIDRLETITVRPIVGCAPVLRSGTPALVRYSVDGRRLQVGAIVVSCGSGGAVLQLQGGEQRRSPRYRRPIAVTIDVPQTSLGVVDGITEDISLGGLRAIIPVAIPADQRAFISLAVVAADPILMMGRTLSCAPVAVRGGHALRVQFTLVSACDQARLFAVLDWPVLEPSAEPARAVVAPEMMPQGRAQPTLSGGHAVVGRSGPRWDGR
jgi:hypothetical protein